MTAFLPPIRLGTGHEAADAVQMADGMLDAPHLPGNRQWRAQVREFLAGLLLHAGHKEQRRITTAQLGDALAGLRSSRDIEALCDRMRSPSRDGNPPHPLAIAAARLMLGLAPPMRLVLAGRVSMHLRAHGDKEIAHAE